MRAFSKIVVTVALIGALYVIVNLALEQFNIFTQG
jgi:hypothetical protein